MKFDLSLLRSMSGKDEQFVREMVDVFIRQYSEIEVLMKVACNQANWLEVGRQAHKLKASIDTMSINSLKQLIREIEQDGKEGRSVSGQCDQLFGEMDGIILEMKSQIS